jgi:SAM-dependent methyltransferase
MTQKALDQLQAFLNMELREKEKIKLLEAGCGSATYLQLDPKVDMVGIDISAEQLECNPKLQEKILGDIQVYAFPPEHFDVIICWNVLEHVVKPELALRNFKQTLKPGGLLVLSLPNLYSLKGLVTRLTPHWFHVTFWRYGYGIKNAGKDNRAPFKTFMRHCASPRGIEQFARENDLEIIYQDQFDVIETLRQRSRFMMLTYALLDRVARFISFGKLGDSEYYLVLRKPIQANL